MNVIETDRLLLRAYERGDLAAMAAMYGDAEVTAFTKLGRLTREQAEAVLESYLAVWRGGGEFGMRAMLRKPGLDFVGECGLFRTSDGGVALRYALARSHWGEGYAPEAVRATIDDAFRTTGLGEILSYVQARNTGSLRVMAKAGWTDVETLMDGDLKLQLFRLTRDAWLRLAATSHPEKD
jgi:ribosomal-protein-alanine N-acetyltransferase